MYEVEASKVAQQKGSAPDVIDLAVMEVHDHTLVNNGLKKVATEENIQVSDKLNATFQQRLQTLQSKSGAEFEAAYLTDMEEIHAMDEKLFAKEATDGSATFQPFARQTDLVVKRHIGALHAVDAS
jgi:putative membrane protein